MAPRFRESRPVWYLAQTVDAGSAKLVQPPPITRGPALKGLSYKVG